MKIAVAVVNYNTHQHLRACLETAVAERPGQIIVVDNGSTDGSTEMVRTEFPEVELIAAPNEGYGAGSNVAVQHAVAPYVLVLNSDTRLHPGCLAALEQYLDSHPKVGMAAPRLVNPDGSLQRSVYPEPSPLAELIRWTSLAAVAARFPRLRERYFVDWPHSHAASVGWVVGAALAIRKEAFDAVGGYDQSFFMYSEEVDLAYCLEKAGWLVDFVPSAVVTHYGGASTEAHRSEMMALLFASMHRFYDKHFSRAWQRQLRVIITYLMLRNLLRDRWRLLRTECPTTARQLGQDLAAWRDVLRLTWDER